MQYNKSISASKHIFFSFFGHILWQSQTISSGKGQKILLCLKGTFFPAILNIHPHKSKSKTDKYLFSVKQNIISSTLNISDFEVSNQSEKERKHYEKRTSIIFDTCDNWQRKQSWLNEHNEWKLYPVPPTSVAIMNEYHIQNIMNDCDMYPVPPTSVAIEDRSISLVVGARSDITCR